VTRYVRFRGPEGVRIVEVPRRSVHRRALPIDPVTIASADDQVHGARQRVAVMQRSASPGELVGTPVVAEGCREIAKVIAMLPDRVAHQQLSLRRHALLHEPLHRCQPRPVRRCHPAHAGQPGPGLWRGSIEREGAAEELLRVEEELVRANLPVGRGGGGVPAVAAHVRRRVDPVMEQEALLVRVRHVVGEEERAGAGAAHAAVLSGRAEDVCNEPRGCVAVRRGGAAAGIEVAARHGAVQIAMEVAGDASIDERAVVGVGLATARTRPSHCYELAVVEVFAEAEGAVSIVVHLELAVKSIVRPIVPAGSRVRRGTGEGAERGFRVVPGCDPCREGQERRQPHRDNHQAS